MIFLKALTKKINLAVFGILGFLSLFLIGRNSKLAKLNESLNRKNKNQNKTIKIQKKVIDVAKNTKPTDIAGNIERMYQDKL